MRRVVSASRSQPGDGRHFRNVFRMQQSLHGPAMRMTADHDVGHFQAVDREFNRCRFSARRCVERRDNVPRVAQHEQVTRIGVRDQVGIDPGIGAGDKQRFGYLPRRQPLKQLTLGAKYLRSKMVDSCHKFLNWHFAGSCRLSIGTTVPQGAIELAVPLRGHVCHAARVLESQVTMATARETGLAADLGHSPSHIPPA